MKDVLALSVIERIQPVEDIWDTIAASGESVPVSDALREELDRRVEDHRIHPDSGTDWESLKHRLNVECWLQPTCLASLSRRNPMKTEAPRCGNGWFRIVTAKRLCCFSL